MIENFFVELSAIIIIATVICGVLKLLRQPLIIGYIITGIVVSPYFLNIVRSTDAVSGLSQIGVAFLLFMVGLNLNPKIIREQGMVSLLTGIGQIIFTSIIGFLIAHYAFGFAFIPAWYIAIALTFSSTIIIMKLLSDKREIDSLHGKISIGFLLVQDIVAIIILLGISLASGVVTKAPAELYIGSAAIAGLFLLSLALKRIGSFIAKSQEYLYLFAISWVLVWAAAFEYAGLSIEIGALISGITLSAFPYRFEISSKIKPIRDFFIILFFVFLGLQMQFANFGSFIVPIIAFSLFILVGNPLIVMAIMGSMGYTKKTGFLSGLVVAQISEFSLILIILGIKVGHLSNEIISMLTVIGLITITVSSYMILYSERLYQRLSPILSVFERKGKKIDQYSSKKNKDHEIVLFGYNRIGYDIVKSLKNMKKKFLVIDFDPAVIKQLEKAGIDYQYGDADDLEFLDSINMGKFRIVISTIPNYEINTLLLEKTKGAFICVSHDIEESIKLYEKGAAFVVMPHFLGGRYAGKVLEQCKADKKLYKKESEKQMESLKTRMEKGHTHPHNKY